MPIYNQNFQHGHIYDKLKYSDNIYEIGLEIK